MKIRIEGFIVAMDPTLYRPPAFSWTSLHPGKWDRNSLVVGPHAIEFDVPDDYDYRTEHKKASLVRLQEMLERHKREREEFEKEVR